MSKKQTIYYTNIGKRFKLDPDAGVNYVLAPNDKLVRRMQRRGIMMHKSAFMQKVDKFRKELHALAPSPGKHPREKRAEKRRREMAQASIR